MAGSTNNVTARLKLTGQKAFGSGLKATEHGVAKIGHAFTKLPGLAKAGFAGVAAAGAVGTVALAGIATKAVQDALESRKIGKLTEQVIKSTGGAAKITAAQVGDLAGAISNKTGVDDEAIQSGSNMLLTFTRIRNEVGKGNNIFDRATAAIVDMGAAMGKDPVKSSVMLGKALNDPIKGVSALSKVGVTFDDQQKKQIKRFAESGKMAKAQGVILDELAKEFGGAAAATGSPLDKLNVQIGNLSEDLGGVLLPYVDRFATWMGRKGVPLIERGAQAFGPKLGGAVNWLGRAWKGAQPALDTAGRWIRTVLQPAQKSGQQDQFKGIREGWGSFSKSLKRNSPWLKQVAGGLLKLVPVLLEADGKISGKGFKLLGQSLGIAIDGFRIGLQVGSKFGRFIINMFGDILHAANRAFGWLDPTGKLDKADKAFQQFRDSANKAFDGIDATLRPKLETREFDEKLNSLERRLGISGLGGASPLNPNPEGRTPVTPSSGRRAAGKAKPAAFSTAGNTIVVPAPRTDVNVTLNGKPIAKEVTVQQRRTAVRR